MNMFNFGQNDPNPGSSQGHGQGKQESEPKAKKSEKEIAEKNKQLLAKAMSKSKNKASAYSKFAKKPDSMQNTTEVPKMQTNSSYMTYAKNPQSLPTRTMQQIPPIPQVSAEQHQPRRPSFFGDSIQQHHNQQIQQQANAQQNLAQQVQRTQSQPPQQQQQIPAQQPNQFQNSYINSAENPFLSPDQIQQQRRDSNAGAHSKERAIAMYIQQMQNHQKQHEAANTRIKESQEAIEKFSQQLEECLVKENYSEADNLSKKISSIKTAVSQYEKTLSQSLNDALLLASEAPSQLATYNEDQKAQIPSMQERKKQFDELLVKLVDQQQLDKLEKEKCKQETDEKLAVLSEPLKLRQTEFEARHAAYDDKVQEAERPHKEKIEQLKQEKLEHENEIKVLLEEIEQHRKSVRELTAQIQQEEKNSKKAADEFKAELLMLNKDIKQFEAESQSAQKEIKEAEAKYQNLVQLVEQREKDIVSTTEKLDALTNQLENAEKDQTILDITTQRIKDLCDTHKTYLETRQTALSIAEEANQKLRDFDTSTQNLSTEHHALEAKIQKCKATIESVKTQVPQLETQKQNAVAAKNFKEAGQFSNQIKALESQGSEAEVELQKAEERIQVVEKELENVDPNHEELEKAASEANHTLVNMDLGFYKDIESYLTTICNESPFCEKVLGPLAKMVSLEIEILNESNKDDA